MRLFPVFNIFLVLLMQAPSMGRRAIQDPIPEISVEGNGETSAESPGQLTSAQRVAATSASSNDVSPELFGREGKHFTETRVLHRDVSTVLIKNPCLVLSILYEV